MKIDFLKIRVNRKESSVNILEKEEIKEIASNSEAVTKFEEKIESKFSNNEEYKKYRASEDFLSDFQGTVEDMLSRNNIMAYLGRGLYL